MVRGSLAIAAAAALLAALAGSAPAGTPLLPSQKGALQAIQRAVASGRIDPATAATARGEIARAARLVRGLPSGRGEPVGVALSELAAFSGRLTKPRALALVGQLKANDDYFAKHYAPAPKTDIVDADGIVYRYFAGRCLEYHPLANFGALNARVAAGDVEGAQRLADALIARGVYQPGGGVAWEYFFPFAGGRAPWISGMAQAVAAQAFARTAELVPDEGPALLRAAHAAYSTIPHHLLTTVAAGPWIKLYSFGSLVVLNAQLQTVLSLRSYATAAQDPGASALAGRMQQAVAATLPRFDTGYWSLYALPHERSPLDYQQYVVQLLKRLSTADGRFASAATRFDAYDHQPPAFMLANGGVGTLRFWLSKPASVTVTSAAGPAKHLSLSDGWHTVAYKEPTRAGAYPVHVSSVDWAGNRASFDALPIVRAAATAAKPKRVRSTQAAPASAPPPLMVGAGLADPSQASAAQRAGLRLVRFGIAWPSPATAPDPGLVAALQRVPAGLGIVVELNAAPADDPGRAALAQYATSLVQQVPAIREVLLVPAPTTAAVPGYVATLTAVRNAIVAAGLPTAVGPLVDGAATPKTTVTALGRALATAGVAPYADVVGFRPAASPAKNLWTIANVPQLTAALVQSLGISPPVLVDGLVASPAAAAAAISSAACSTTLAGLVLDTLAVDPSVTAAAATAERGTVVCPGVAAGVDASTLEFPTELAPPAPAQVVVACTRDCLYLATLVRADGTPVVATRGALRGGGAPATISLPRTTLKAGSYAIDLRLVARVNPGLVTRVTSPPLVAS